MCSLAKKLQLLVYIKLCFYAVYTDSLTSVINEHYLYVCTFSYKTLCFHAVNTDSVTSLIINGFTNINNK